MVRNFKSDLGQAVVEFCLIALFFFTIVFGILESGFVLYDKVQITNACREGAREGVLFRVDTTTFEYSPLSENEIRTVVGNYLQNRLVTFGNPFNPASDVSVTWNPAPPSRGGEINVQVQFDYTSLIFFRLLNMGTGAWNLKARSIMRME